MFCSQRLAMQTSSSSLPGFAPGRAALAVVGTVLVLRGLIEGIWLLPSPVGDSIYFLTASVNYCQSGFLGTTAFPIDPSGQSRMVWHGFVSPMLFGALNSGCSAPVFYTTLWLIKVLTAAAILLVARNRGYSFAAAVGAVMLTLAAQSCIAFRPESVAILLIVLAELAIDGKQPILLGALMGSLLCTQPTVAGLHGLVLILARPVLLRDWWKIGVGYAIAAAALLAIYPFPIADLIGGILLQAKHLVGRNDGDVASYYLSFPLLPGWSVLLIASGFVIARRRPLLLLTLPVFYFFGPRVPPTFYNLLPSCVLLLLIACSVASRRTETWLGIASCLVGTLGLALLTMRDAMTVVRYGDTFSVTRSEVRAMVADGARIAVAPAFLSLTNPELHITAPRATGGAPGRYPVELYAVNGHPNAPCASRHAATPVSLKLWNRTLFNSNSGWTVYVCGTGDSAALP
jgi:hypothetical protein